MQIEQLGIDEIRPYERNAKRHPKNQIAALAASLEEYGWTLPLLIDAEGNLIAGHGRLEAAKSIGIETVPVVRKTDISEEQVRAYRIADNRLADLGTWNTGNLKLEMQELSVAGFNLGKIGFTPGAASKVLGVNGEAEDCAPPRKSRVEAGRPVGVGPAPDSLWRQSS